MSSVVRFWIHKQGDIFNIFRLYHLHTNTRLDKPPKVLLMDRHRSYMDPKFTIKATVHNIHPYPFPRHLTYILQPLNVGVFQPYKH
jgi:hypothetical protein